MSSPSAEEGRYKAGHSGGSGFSTHYWKQGKGCGHPMKKLDPHQEKCLYCCGCSASNRCSYTLDFDFSSLPADKPRKKRSYDGDKGKSKLKSVVVSAQVSK
jgi:hypothetical protein